MSARPRILTLDDDVLLLEMLADRLEAAGFEVKTLREPTRTVPTAISYQPHLILMDRHMPVLSGGEVARALASFPETRSIPIAFLTADTSWAEVVRAVLAGAVDVMHKPVDDAHISRIRDLVIELSARQTVPDQKEVSVCADNLVAVMRRNGATGCMRLNAGTAFEGRAIFRSGDFVGADYGPLSGMTALEEMLAYEDGVWSYEDTTRPRLVYPPPPLPRSTWEDITHRNREVVSFDDPTLPRVLFVDDAPELRKLYERQLVRAGLNVDVAEDGEEGWQKLLNGRYDVVLADLNMPRLDGWGLLRRMRSDHRTREVPVLFLSAHDDYRETLKAARAGARDYLAKTGRSEHVIERVMAAIAPRSEVLAGLLRGGEVRVPLHLVGPQWFLHAVGQLQLTGRLDAHDDWGHYTVTVRQGDPLQTVSSNSGRTSSGVAGLAALLVSRAVEATFTQDESFAGQPSPGWSMGAALHKAVDALNTLESRVSRERLRGAERFTVDEALYGLYRRVGSDRELALARAVCEEQIAPARLAEHLGISPEDVERGLRELLRRRVISISESDGAG